MVEREFNALGFILKEDCEGNQSYGDKGQPLYVKSFIKHHNKQFSFCYIEGSQDPSTEEYSLKLDNLAHLKAWEADKVITEEMVAAFGEGREEEHIDDIVGSFKQEKGIPTSVNLGVEVRYKPKELSVSGSDLNSIYQDFEQALIALGYIE